MKPQINLHKADIEFNTKDGKVKFSIVHNLGEINPALCNWLARTKKYTAKSLCKYIMSKDESFVAMPYKKFRKLFE